MAGARRAPRHLKTVGCNKNESNEGHPFYSRPHPKIHVRRTRGEISLHVLPSVAHTLLSTHTVNSSKSNIVQNPC
jgi:hypothetical protein